MNRILGTLIGGAIGLWLLSYAAFIVDQRRFAIVTSDSGRYPPDC